MSSRWLEGKRSFRNELAVLFVKGIPRTPYWETRGQLCRFGIQQHWIADMTFVQNNVLEMLVHEERAEEIASILSRIGKIVETNIASLVGADLATSEEFLRSTRLRLAKRLETLDPRRRGVRFHIKSRMEELDENLKRRVVDAIRI